MLDIQIENIDESKADLGVRHEYVPQVAFNLAIENEEERVVVDCDHFLPGEMSKYMTTNEDREMAYDLRKVFSKKVKGIRNLRINGKSVTTAEAILKYPSTLELDALVLILEQCCRIRRTEHGTCRLHHKRAVKRAVIGV